MNSVENVLLGNIKTALVSRNELANIMLKDCLNSRKSPALPKLVFSSNGQGLSLAAENREFKAMMDQADIVHADGMSLVLASKILLKGRSLPERVATSDFFYDAAEVAQANGLSFFILGGSEELNIAACQSIQTLYPSLKIAGRHHGYFSEEHDATICDMIKQSKADVLWVGLGKPKQEFWSVRNRERLRGVGWIKTCGGLYAFLTGMAPRAPRWMQYAGLEWLHRTINDPKNYGWRYLKTNPHAIYLLATKSRKTIS